MGLPLYRAPVESDIKAKVPKDPPTRARSTIRRTRRNIGDSSSHSTTASRFYTRRHGRVFSPPADSPWTPWDNVEPGEANTNPRLVSRRSGLTDPYPISQDSGRPVRHSDPALREVMSRNGMSQEVVRYFGERMARLHAGTSSRTPDGEEREPSSGPPEQDPRSWLITGDRPRQTPRFTPTTHWTTPHRPEVPARTSLGQPPEQTRVAEVLLRRQDGHVIAMRRVLRSVRDARTRSTPDDAPQELRFDGLGDRDRSLSPEGDGVWDTLLSSITPDPQPPSVGTSFASTSAPASAATSQSTTNSAHSSHTSLAAPAPPRMPNAEDFEFDHPCESGGENSDTEGDDEESNENTLRRIERSYADVVAHTQSHRDDDTLEMFGTVESMQRIVRNLARREDIPDEWWAQAGLSRSLPREAA